MEKGGVREIPAAQGGIIHATVGSGEETGGAGDVMAAQEKRTDQEERCRCVLDGYGSVKRWKSYFSRRESPRGSGQGEQRKRYVSG